MFHTCIWPHPPKPKEISWISCQSACGDEAKYTSNTCLSSQALGNVAFLVPSPFWSMLKAQPCCSASQLCPHQHVAWQAVWVCTEHIYLLRTSQNNHNLQIIFSVCISCIPARVDVRSGTLISAFCTFYLQVKWMRNQHFHWHLLVCIACVSGDGGFWFQELKQPETYQVLNLVLIPSTVSRDHCKRARLKPLIYDAWHFQHRMLIEEDFRYSNYSTTNTLMFN